MDSSRFAALCLALGTGVTRRTAVGALAGMLGLGVTFDVDSRSKSKRRRQRRRTKQQRRTQRRHALQATNCDGTLQTAGCQRDSASGYWVCPRNTNLTKVNLMGCDLRGATLRQIFLTDARLDGAILNNAHLDGSQAHGIFLNSATMVEATFLGTNLGGGHFRGADMRKADFTGASLNSADLADGARQYGAIFQNADLRGVKWVNVFNPRSPYDKMITHCPDEAHLLWPSDCCGHLNGYTTPNC